MSKQKMLQILLMATKGEDMACQLDMNQVGRSGRIDVKAEDIIDIIDSYKWGGYMACQLDMNQVGTLLLLQDWGN